MYAARGCLSLGYKNLGQGGMGGWLVNQQAVKLLRAIEKYTCDTTYLINRANKKYYYKLLKSTPMKLVLINGGIPAPGEVLKL